MWAPISKHEKINIKTMSLYIDRHELNGTVSADEFARDNVNDIKVQHKFNCRKISYWFDENNKTAFCLFEAPNIECIRAMHKHVHGDIPNQIIEVDQQTVDTVLNELLTTQDNKVNIDDVSDTAFTTIMATTFETNELNTINTQKVKKFYSKSALELIHRFNGNIISQTGSSFLVAFHSGAAATNCALKMNKSFHSFEGKKDQCHIIKTGLSGCVRQTNKPGAYIETIKLAKRLCYLSRSKILMTLEVRNLYLNEGRKGIMEGEGIKLISPDDVKFITILMNYMERNWKDQNLQVSHFQNELACSKSQIYRKMMSLMGQSPNSFIKEYRLNRSKDLLRKKSGNISEIAFDSGFSSPSYFSKCFQKEYGIKPSEYFQFT